jgi:hypothetical protein
MQKEVFPLAALFALIGAAPLAHAGLVLDVATGGSPATCSGCGADGTVFGWSFFVNSPITVDGIGIWDSDSAPLPVDTEAGLFDNLGNLLASVEITNASTPVPSVGADGQWLFETIAPLTLTPGIYELGSVTFDSGPAVLLGAPFFSIPQITLIDGVLGPADGGLQAPLEEFPDGPVFGPTLETVPEPGMLGLLISASAALALGRALKMRRSKPILQ